MPWTIVINMDRKCRLCGRAGAVEAGGICLRCVGKRIRTKLRKKGGRKP